MRLFLVLATLTAAHATAQAPRPTAVQVPRQTTAQASRPTTAQAPRPTTAADARRILSALAADSMEGRGTATAGARRAAMFIAAEMRRNLLAPLGDSGFFQRVPMVLDSVRMRNRGNPADSMRVRIRARGAASFAARDSLPPGRRGGDVNVVAVIHGSHPVLRHQYVLVAAHHDHLGIVTPVAGDSIANGADDDATGVTAVIEIARQMREGPPPERTVVFATMTGEEVGFIGTNWFMAHPPFPLDSMAAMLALEMIARPDSLAPGAGGLWLTGHERSTMGDLIARSGVNVHPDRRPEHQFFLRSDNTPFARRGIVAHTLSSYNMHGEYHTVSDDLSRVDFAHMAAAINNAAAAVRALAAGPRPEWKPGGRPR
jgi:hypothetical protein